MIKPFNCIPRGKIRLHLMKQLICLVLLISTACLDASSYDDREIGSFFQNREPTIEFFSDEIARIECSSSYTTDHSIKKVVSMYGKRADLNFAKKNYQAALGDYQKVISYMENPDVYDPSDFLNSICGCLFSYQCLDEDESANQEFNKLVYHTALLGDEIDKIEWFRESPGYHAYKRNHGNHRAQISVVDLPDMTPEESCQLQCAGYAVAAASACLRVPNLTVSAICAGCIWGLEQVCSRCCKGEGFWKNCVKPLRRLFHDPEHPNNPAPHPYE